MRTKVNVVRVWVVMSEQGYPLWDTVRPNKIDALRAFDPNLAPCFSPHVQEFVMRPMYR